MKSAKWMVGAGLAALAAVTAYAQLPGITRTPVQEQDLGSLPGRQAVVARVEFAPGALVPKHTHAGEEIGYVVEGTIELIVEGQPPRIVKAGEGFLVPAGIVHEGRNTGSDKAVVLATYVHEKGKPVATMVK
ncbi:MAG TPA: cupin domain-containing protein [Burkholderiales bacterium]|jgi:quercetin dioxygenase-like cupin family protein